MGWRLTGDNDGHTSIRRRHARQRVRIFELIGIRDDNRQLATVSSAVQAETEG